MVPVLPRLLVMSKNQLDNPIIQ